MMNSLTQEENDTLPHQRGLGEKNCTNPVYKQNFTGHKFFSLEKSKIKI